MQFAIVADDLTGATDSGAQLARAGYQVAVAFHGAPLPSEKDFDAVVVDTDSRQLAPEAAARRVAEVAARLAHARIFCKKIDSTLRGPVAAEVKAALRASGRPRAVAAPAFPANGRTTVDGLQLVHGEAVHETSFANDPLTSAREGHIPSLLATAGLSGIGALTTVALDEPDAVRAALTEHRWLVADATEDSHLRSLVAAVPDPAEVLWVGSAGLVKALGSVYPGLRVERTHPERYMPGEGVVVVVGSTNEVSRKQLRRLRKDPEVATVALSTSAVVAGRKDLMKNALWRAVEALDRGESVALYPTDEKVPEGGAGLVVEALARTVAGLSEKGLFGALALTGGDTAVHVSRSLGARGILLEGEIESGVATGTLIGPCPYRVVTKAGGFGTPDTLLHALRALAPEKGAF